MIKFNSSMQAMPDLIANFFAAVLQHVFLFVIMFLILMLFVSAFLYFTQLESQGKMKTTIFLLILSLVAMIFIETWMINAFGLELLMGGYFTG